MSTAETTWICCPAGVDNGKLRLAVVVVPRLETDGDQGELGSFAAFADWPDRVAGLDWLVSFAGGPADVAGTTVGEPPDLDLWRAVFPAPTPVRTLGADVGRIDRAILSYPAAEVADAVRAGYADAAAAETVDRAGTAADALGTAFAMGPLEAFRTSLARGLEEARTAAAGRDPTDRGLVPVAVGNASGSDAVARAYAFQQPGLRVTGDPPAPVPTLDFHQVLTLLGDHPLLLRRLGLVVDLVVPLAGVDAAVTGVRVSAASPLPEGPVHNLPTTALVISPGGAEVRVRARDEGFADGVWPLDRPEYHLESLDVDGAVRQGVVVGSGEATRPDAGPPALRNDGIALVHTGRAEALRGRLVDVRERRSTVSAAGQDDETVVEAEDLFRGFRVDVHDDAAGVFRTLHARRIRYQVDGFGDLPSADGFLEDEGFFQESLTGDTELYVHERLVTWRGWSLSALRPDGTRRVARPAPVGDPSETLASLHTHLVCEVRPGTLPRLRFGHSYRLRLRTVDLAGVSVPIDLAPDTGTGELTFRRYEPVLPPSPVSAGATPDFAEGETVARLVIRAPVVQDVLIFPVDETPPPCERLLLPPRSTIALAEQHGLFDDALGNADRAVRTARRALLPRIEQQLSYPVGDTVPYLADPQAAGVAFTGLPGTADGELLRIDFPGDSPDTLAPLRLRLETSEQQFWPAPSAPSYDEGSRTLRVFLAPGDRRTVRVSTVLRDPDLMALLHDAGSRRDGAERAALETRIRDSQHTMVTPYAEIELVHATSIAERSDFTTAVTPRRGAGESAAGLVTTVAVDPRTVDAFEMRATWQEELDQGPDGLPVTVTRSATVYSHRLPPDAAAALPAIAGDAFGRHQLALDSDALGLPRHELGTTGHRTVTYRPTATTRFTDCYPPGSVRVGEGLSAEVPILSTVAPPPPVVSDVVPSQIVFSQGQERFDPDVLVLVPAVGTPPPDELPGEAGWTKATQLRTGGGIRVYLDRPWFVSGSGEMLGVVLGDPSLSVQPVPGSQPGNWAYAENNPVPQLISQVGQDPIRLTPGVQPLTAADFLNVEQTGALPALPDAADARRQVPVTILGFRPRFEVASGCWYVDIRVNADKAYMPFFRLAVVRYQPMSISEAISISRVTTLDVIQPLPTRQLSVIRHGQDPEVTVTLRGTTYLEPDTRVSARVTCSLFTAESPTAQHWRPVEGFADVDLPRPQRQPDAEFVVPTGLTATVDWWSAKLTLPAAEPGQVQRLLVVERDQLHSEVDDTGPGSTRILHVGTIDL